MDWPTKNIELIVPFTAGGVSDILARSFAEAAKGIIDQPITIKNVGGGSGTVGNYELVKAKPDGYTWLWAATGHMSSALHITPAQYTKDDFTIVNKVGDMVVTVVVPKDSPFRTLQDLIGYAKEHPGEVTVGNPGEGTVVAMLATMLEDSVGIKLQHVPFQGSGTLLPAVLGKHVMAGFMNVPEIRGQVEAGDLRALAVLSENRVDLLPNVPTGGEQGVKGVTGGAGHFIIIPNKVPDDVVQRIDELTKAVYESDKFKQLMNQAGYQLGYKKGSDAKAEVDEWFVTTGEIYKKLGQIK
ncbi:tripartite tricarboxylate transporter substrate binding protein [Paenibacillus flagellatus]|uniref:tripartite tricarboxylate transporter substrate binding protein n=1 Tax=Paenibacillus flagellatus TaxID=2211139 RepID=UPI001FE4551C|nr:tripartite tricarboxylate transporter substrate binding protein [Paenibacillus flagellatus]